jgi:uncharacterized protein with PQ loop repeat
MPRVAHTHIARHHKTLQKKSFIDKLIYVVAVLEPMANLPQIVTIYTHQDATGVSITSWVLYALFGATWLWYGIHTKQRPMITGGFLFVITDMIVVIGSIAFGGKVL